MRPQSEDRRKADPETDGEFLDPADVENPAEPKLPPFQVRLKLSDESAALKEEDGSFLGELIYLFQPKGNSLDSVASGLVEHLPPALEKAGLQCIIAKDGTEGGLVRLMVEIIGYQLSDILPKQMSEDFKTALSSLPPLIAPLGAQKEYDAVLEKVKEFYKIKWMQKIPKMFKEHLRKMGLEAETSVEPPPPELPKPGSLPAPDGLRLHLRVELPNRLALAQAVQPSLTEAAVKNMSQADFFRLIHPKLEEHIAKAISDKLGASCPFEAEPQSDTDFGNHSKHSFWLPLTIHHVDKAKALHDKGEAFEGNFSKFLSSLDKLTAGGVAGLAEVANDLRATAGGSVLKDLHTDLARRVAELLPAEVQGVSSSAYESLQKQAADGICCRSEKKDGAKAKSEQVYWVLSNVTDGPDGPAGLCPAISDKSKPPCVAGPQSHEKVSLHHRPYTECFNLAELKFVDEVPSLTAAKISAKCGSS